jgi:hypothetical protein
MSREMRGRWHWLVLIIACAGIGLWARGDSPASATTAEPPPQDVMSLDRRILALEQRLYPLESNVRRLEQQTASLGRPMPSQPTLRDPEIDRLRGEVELLRARIQELECGLVRVDERTLSPAMRESRRRAGGQVTDPCRANAEASVQIRR